MVLISTKKVIWFICFLFVTSNILRGQIGDCSQSIKFHHFLHIAHTRTGTNPLMDPLVEQIDFSTFDMLWLGGDLALATSESDSAMIHVDSVFNLGNESTLWALGNHDYSDLERVQSFTHRKPYYASYSNNITFLVLDTQDSLSNIIGDQLDLFRRVTDTIHESTHLVLLHHKLFWMYGNPDLQSKIASVTNGGFGDCFYCINPNNFYPDLYPALIEVEQRGIDVICIAGDIGFRKSEFEFITPEGIQFLASGIEAGNTNNKVLLFRYESVSGTLDWQYLALNQLLIPLDITPPLLHSVSITPDSVLQGETIMIIIEAEDRESGLSEFRVDVVNPFGQQLIAISCPVESSTSMGDMKYAIELVIPDTAVTGRWSISSIEIIDSSENIFCEDYLDNELVSFLVTSPSVDVEVNYPQALIYPNPGIGIFYFDTDLTLMQIVDQTGRVTDVSSDIDVNYIDLSDLPKGVYFFRMRYRNGSVILQKVIIH